MRIKFTLLILLTSIAQFSYGQQKESSLDIHTDIKAYEKIKELAFTDSIQQRQIALLAADTVDWKAKFERQVKTADSIAFENNKLQSDVGNVITNCQKSLNRQTFWGSVFKYTALIAGPVAVVSTTLLFIK